MRSALLIFVALVSAASGYKSPTGYVAPTRRGSDEEAATSTAATTAAALSSTQASSSTTTPSKPTTTAAPLTTFSALPTSSSTLKDDATEVLTELPISVPPVVDGLLTSDSDADLDGFKRRRIFYDQRQEGQYNIRADLENFMIVLIPPTPTEGLSLLDLLTKSALRRSSLASKSKRKHYASNSVSKYRQQLKHARPTHLQLMEARRSPAADLPRSYFGASPVAPAHPFSEYIEGRTPYHVDISASDEEQTRLHLDRPVDVLPPPFPLAYQHLIKPYHLEAEPTVIQALPPAELNAATSPPRNYLDGYNPLLAQSSRSSGNADVSFTTTIANTSPSITTSTLTPRADGDSRNGGYYRISRAIRGGDNNNLDINRVSNGLSGVPPIYRVEHSMGARDMYPPIDVPRQYTQLEARHAEPNNLEIDRVQTLEEPDNLDYSRVDPFFLSTDELPSDEYADWDRFMDDIGKDRKQGVRCAPGQRRDSYGVCREIKGY